MLTLEPDVEGRGCARLVGRELDADAVALAQQTLKGDALGLQGVIEERRLVVQATIDHHPGGRGKDRKTTDTQRQREACAASAVSGASLPDPDPDSLGRAASP